MTDRIETHRFPPTMTDKLEVTQAEYGRIHTDGSRSGGQPPAPVADLVEAVAWRTEYRDKYKGYDTGWHFRYHSTQPHPAPLTSEGSGHKNITPLYEALPDTAALVAEVDELKLKYAALKGMNAACESKLAEQSEAATRYLAQLTAASAKIAALTAAGDRLCHFVHHEYTAPRIKWKAATNA